MHNSRACLLCARPCSHFSVTWRMKPGVQEFAHFVQYAEQVMAMPLPVTLPRLELLQRLHYATEGVVGNLMNLLRYAAWLTRQQQQEAITLPSLATAYDKRLAKHLKKTTNPFLSAPDEAFSVEPMDKDENLTRMRRQLSAAEVLQAR